MVQDIRWVHRFSNYIKALDKLIEAVDYIRENLTLEKYDPSHPGRYEIMDQIIKEGLIQRFEYTHELAWNVMKDYAVYQGISNVGGSRDSTREGFRLGLISNGEIWMEMLASRNITSHTYNEKTAEEILQKILNDYYPAFLEFRNNMDSRKNREEGVQ
jgi:nucleotidyltransferase substrate binding protein (TIGR01987 family)